MILKQEANWCCHSTAVGGESLHDAHMRIVCLQDVACCVLGICVTMEAAALRDVTSASQELTICTFRIQYRFEVRERCHRGVLILKAGRRGKKA